MARYLRYGNFKQNIDKQPCNSAGCGRTANSKDGRFALCSKHRK